MAEEVIGSAGIKIGADASGVKAGVWDAKTALQSLRDAAKEAGESLNASSTKYLLTLSRQSAALEKQAATFGKTKSEIAEYNSAQMAVSDTASTMVQRMAVAETSLTAQGAAAKAAAVASSDLGASAEEAGAGLGAININSISAQRSLISVGRALAQGNYPRAALSMVSLAARTGAASVFFSALGLTVLGAAVALGAFVVAAVKGQQETKGLQDALILTGGYAGVTSEQLGQMAVAISALGGTQGKAAEGLTQLAASGKVAGDQFVMITEAAIGLERAGGPAIQTTIDKFIQIGEDPVKAVEKINETEHFLTETIYEQIKALQEQGDKVGAAAIASAALTAADNARTAEMKANLGTLQKLWLGLGDVAKGAWNLMLNIGRPSAVDPTAAIQKTIDSTKAAQARAGDPSIYDAPLKALQDQLGVLQQTASTKEAIAISTKKNDDIQNAGIAALKTVDTLTTNAQSKQEKMNSDLAAAKLAFAALAAANPYSPALLGEQAVLDKIRADAVEKPKRTKAVTDDAATKMLQTLRDQNAAYDAQLAVESTLTESEKARAVFVQLIADLKSKTILTADQKSLLAGQDAIKVALDLNVAKQAEIALRKSDSDAADKAFKDQEEADAKRITAITTLRNQIIALDATMADSLQKQQDQSDAKLGAMGMGAQASAQLASIKDIDRQYSKYLEDFRNKAGKAGTLDSSDYVDEVQKIKAALASALAANSDYYAQLKVKQADWSNGAKEALANYVDGAKDVAGQTKGLFDDAFKGMEDALVTFVTTGKLSFTDLANSILADLARIIIKQELAAAYTAAMGSSGGGSSWLGTILSAVAGVTSDTPQTGGQVGVGFHALGGPVAANSLSYVNEQGPEMLRVGGRDMLMMGAQGGTVTPNSGTQGQASAPNVTINVASGVTRNEVAAMIPSLKAQIKAELFSTMRRPGFQRG